MPGPRSALWRSAARLALAGVFLAAHASLAAPDEDALFDFITSSGFTKPPAGLMLCYLGHAGGAADVARRVLEELLPPQHRAHVAFFRQPTEARPMVEGFAREFPERAHAAQESMEAFEGLCSMFILSADDPRFTAEDIRFLGRSTGAVVAHLQGCADGASYACRFFRSSWEALVGEEASCARHFCMAVIPPEHLEILDDPWQSSVNCSAMQGPAGSLSQASQWQQDWFVYRNFVRGTELDAPAERGAAAPRRGVFVDIGAFHPIHLSNTFFFERCLGWHGVCAEPNPNWVPFFNAYRPHCELVRNCVWSGPRKVVMSFQKDPIEAYIQEDQASGAVLIEGDGMAKPKFTAECRTLEDILSASGLRKPARVDYMSVDAEAAEVEIFKVFPFGEFDIRVISVEVQARNYYDLDVIFSSANYAKVAVLGGDHVYAKLSKDLRLPDGAAEWHRTLSKDFHAYVEPQTATMK